MDVREASKIVEEIPDHEYIVFHYDIGGPVEERIVQLDGEFTAKQLFAIATVVNYPGLKAGAWEDPDGHVGVIKSLAKKIEDYEVKIIREDKVLAKTKGHYRCPEGL